MQVRSLEAAFAVVGYPASGFTDFDSRNLCRLLSIIGAEGQRVIDRC